MNEVLLAVTQGSTPAVNNSSLTSFKVSLSFAIEFILLPTLFASKLLTLLPSEIISLVALSSALTVEIVNKQIIIIKNKYFFFNIFFPLKKLKFKYTLTYVKCS